MLQWGLHCIYILYYSSIYARLEPCNACKRCLDREASNIYLTKIRSVPLIRCLLKMSPSSSTSTGSQIAIWRQSLTWTRHDFSLDLQSPSTGKMFVWSPVFFTESGSARYSSALSITTVWSNYQTSYNDFFEVYITETVTLSPNIQMVLLTSSGQSIYPSTMSHDQSFFVLIGQNRLQLMFRYDNS